MDYEWIATASFRMGSKAFSENHAKKTATIQTIKIMITIFLPFMKITLQYVVQATFVNSWLKTIK